jgi:spermidine/putrescine transport system permease protein
MKMNKFTLMSFPYIVWIAALIVLPMLLILLYAFTIPGNDVASVQFSFDNFIRFVTDATFLSVVGKSLWIAFLTTVICILLGYPVAYIISKAKGNHGIILILLLTLPTWINMLVRTYAWMGILQSGGILSKLLALFGFEDVTLLYTDFAVALGMVYNFLPFMILQIHTSLAKMDNSLLEAAADLGANKVQSFLRVTLPLSLPGIVSGITLVFLPAVSSFFIPKLLGGGQYVLVGNVIESQFLTAGDWHFGSAISMIMAIIIIISMWLTRKIDVQPTKEN